MTKGERSDAVTVLSPSDISSSGPSPGAERILVGGRLVRSSARWLLTDALGAIEVTFTSSHDGLDDHALAVVEGSPGDGRLLDARLVSVHPSPSDRRSEVARFRDAGLGRALVARARAARAVRAYFAEERFLEVETPSLVPSPGLDRHLDAFEIEGAGDARYLITSPEYQMKRLLAGGIHRCFQLARCFRRGEAGGHHNPEFTMLEWYRAFADMDAVVRDTEEIVRAVSRALGDGERLTVGERVIDLVGPFPRISVAEAFHDLAGVGEDEMLALAQRDEETFFRILVDRIEPMLAARDTPIVLHRYPAKMASLARLAPDDPRFAERFEVYVAGLEISNGFGELTDPSEQRQRLERDQRERREAGQPVYPIDERFLEALEEGFPPSAGNALGFDRLVLLAMGKSRIADVLAFPVGVV